MKQADREEWLAIALDEVRHVPAQQFIDACAHARRTCDHPAKIIPAILGFEPGEYGSERYLRLKLWEARRALENIDAPRIAAPVQDDPAERREVAMSMAELLKELRAGPLAEAAE